MKMKDRVESLETEVAQLKREFNDVKTERLQTKFEDEAEVKRKEEAKRYNAQELWEFPPNVPAIWYKYSFRDVSHLLTWKELPNNAGPLFFTTLIGISGLAGLCYGRTNPKRCFTKLVMQNMRISEPVLAELLYECKRYLHKKSVWAPGATITTAPREAWSKGDIFYGLSVGESVDVIINVIELAQRYLLALNDVFESGEAGTYPLGLGEPDLVVREAAKTLLPPEGCCVEE